jgi:hypothetical protein
MNSRPIRALLVLIAVVIASSAAYVLNNLDTQITQHRSSTDALRDQAAALSASIAEVRAGQSAYVARGQSEPFWMSHVATVMPELERQTSEFAASLTAADAQTALVPGVGALENLRALDARVKEFVKAGTALLAGDLIFSDGLESTRTASAQVAAALTEELQARSNTLDELRRRQVMVAGGAAGAILLLMIPLALTGAAPVKPVAPVMPAAPPVDPVRFEAPLPKAKPAVTPRLVTTAQLCGELARVADGEELPNLLRRAARVLDASGIIVWVVEPARQCLRAALAHGYEEKVIKRMGDIHRDANNAAAAAYRASEVRTVPGDNVKNGALIVPLMTSDGCVGVLSAEMKGGSEKDESSQALAAIFAAQLATLVATPGHPNTGAAFGNPSSAPPMKAAARG